jgi:SAM-dependent methyltransferase
VFFCETSYWVTLIKEKIMPDVFYWDKQYETGDTPWDMRQVSPPLKNYFDQLHNKKYSILIPGCGNSYEAAYLLDQGFTDLTLVDISEVLTTDLKRKFGDRLVLITADFFAVTGQYDLIVEQTFFCALDPALRPAYIEKMYSLLRPGGKLAGVLFDREFQGGPPFGGNRAAYERLLEKRFTLRTMAPCYNSIRPRAGTELFFVAEKN